MQQMSPDHAMARNTKSQERRTTVRRNNGVSSPSLLANDGKWLSYHQKDTGSWFLCAQHIMLELSQPVGKPEDAVWFMAVYMDVDHPLYTYPCHSLSICGFLDFDKFWSFTICFWTSGDDACGRKRDRGHSPPWNFSSALLQKHIWSKANQNPANKLFYFMWAHSQILIWVGNCHAVHVCNLLIHVILVLYVWVYSWHFAPVVWANFKCFSTVQESLHW